MNRTDIFPLFACFKSSSDYIKLVITVEGVNRFKAIKLKHTQRKCSQRNDTVTDHYVLLHTVAKQK